MNDMRNHEFRCPGEWRLKIIGRRGEKEYCVDFHRLKDELRAIRFVSITDLIQRTQTRERDPRQSSSTQELHSCRKGASPRPERLKRQQNQFVPLFSSSIRRVLPLPPISPSRSISSSDIFHVSASCVNYSRHPFNHEVFVSSAILLFLRHSPSSPPDLHSPPHPVAPAPDSPPPPLATRIRARTTATRAPPRRTTRLRIRAMAIRLRSPLTTDHWALPHLQGPPFRNIRRASTLRTGVSAAFPGVMIAPAPSTARLGSLNNAVINGLRGDSRPVRLSLPESELPGNSQDFDFAADAVVDSDSRNPKNSRNAAEATNKGRRRHWPSGKAGCPNSKTRIQLILALTRSAAPSNPVPTPPAVSCTVIGEFLFGGSL